MVKSYSVELKWTKNVNKDEFSDFIVNNRPDSWLSQDLIQHHSKYVPPGHDFHGYGCAWHLGDEIVFEVENDDMNMEETDEAFLDIDQFVVFISNLLMKFPINDALSRHFPGVEPLRYVMIAGGTVNGIEGIFYHIVVPDSCFE